MKNTAFCSSTLSALQQITSIFDFVWPTYTALWNLRWQVQGYLDVSQTEGKKISPEELRRVFVTKEIHGENLLRLCSNDWSIQENLFSQILLAYAFSIYEGWICDLGNLLGWNRNQKISLQFCTQKNPKNENVIGAFVKNWKEKRSNNDELIGKVVYNTAKENKKYFKDSLEDLITCYRCFKEARNAFIHANGKVTDSLKEAYREYSGKIANIKTIMDEAPIFPDPSPDSSSMKEDFALSLRGVVGFYNVIIILIVTLDAKLANSRYAEKILLYRMATEPIKKRKNKTLKSNAISFFSENKIPFDKEKIELIMEPIMQRHNFLLQRHK